MLLNQFILQQIKAQDPNFQGQPLTLDQAAAIANFLRTNNINTPQELEALINGIHGGAAPTGLAELAEAFAGLSGFDPANPNPQDIPALMQLTFAVP
jgi:hypothetical protein